MQNTGWAVRQKRVGLYDKYLALRVPSFVFKEIEKIAIKEKLSPSDVVRLALYEYLQKKKEELIDRS
jgi:metal-responsive CopG/Arc/MetJ family transcriptional regulator